MSWLKNVEIVLWLSFFGYNNIKSFIKIRSNITNILLPCHFAEFNVRVYMFIYVYKHMHTYHYVIAQLHKTKRERCNLGQTRGSLQSLCHTFWKFTLWRHGWVAMNALKFLSRRAASKKGKQTGSIWCHKHKLCYVPSDLSLSRSFLNPTGNSVFIVKFCGSVPLMKIFVNSSTR